MMWTLIQMKIILGALVVVYAPGHHDHTHAPTALSSPSTDSLDFRSGVYRQNSELCTTSVGDGRCPNDAEDRLSIHKLSRDTYKVDLLSVQANQHLCSFSLEMSAIDGALQYRDQTGGSIRLMANGDGISFNTRSLNPSDPLIGFCGPHASLEGLTFSAAALQSTNEEEPPPIALRASYARVEIAHPHHGCSYLFSPMNFCDPRHILEYERSLENDAVNFDGRLILLSIGERPQYHQRSLVVLDPETGVVYPAPFDSYSGPLNHNDEIASEGNLNLSVGSNAFCIDGSLLVYHSIKIDEFCFSFRDGKFDGYQAQYMQK